MRQRIARLCWRVMWTQTIVLALLIVGGFAHARKERKRMSQALDQAISDLKTEITNLQTVDTAAVALINGIPKLISDAIAGASDDSSAVQAVKDVVAQLQSKDTELAAAVTANTPAAPSTP
jgi:uncharacterized protein YlxW (UPF0749 family)